jgi:polysaccharide biosynthesis transport protein
MLGFIGGLSAFLREPRDVRDLLGTIPQMPARRTPVARALATHLDPRGKAAEAFRQISSSVRAMRTILVTGQRRIDGTSVCASNLAIALAQAGRSVVLVDANLAHPVQHYHFDIETSHGLCEAIVSPAALRWSIVSTDIERLRVLPSGTMRSPASELLASEGIGTVIDALATQFDHVVIDGPATGADTGESQLCVQCEAMLMIADRRLVTVHRPA